MHKGHETCSTEQCADEGTECGASSELVSDKVKEIREEEMSSISSRERSGPPITLKLLSSGGYYDMPMAKAAHLLGRTEGSFQRICRGLGILRWPYRMRKSLQAILEKTEQYLDDSAQEDGLSKKEVLQGLRAHMDDIKGISGNGMDKATKQYRQYIFKLNHKLARRAAKNGEDGQEFTGVKLKGMMRAASRVHKSQLAVGEVIKKEEQVKNEGTAKKEPLAARTASRSSWQTGSSSRQTGGGASSNEGVGPTRPIPRHAQEVGASWLPMCLSEDREQHKTALNLSSLNPAGARGMAESVSAEALSAKEQKERLLEALCAQVEEQLATAAECLKASPSSLPATNPNILQTLSLELSGHPAWPHLFLGLNFDGQTPPGAKSLPQ